MMKALGIATTTLVLLLAGCDPAAPGPSDPVPDPATGIRPTVSLLPTPEITLPTGAPASPVPRDETPGPGRPQPPETRDAPRTRVPAKLVGTWDGDRTTISFSRAGDVTVTQKRGGSESGTVVIDGRSMELHLPSGVQAISDWEITRFDAGYGYEFFNLILDGTSYVRDVPK